MKPGSVFLFFCIFLLISSCENPSKTTKLTDKELKNLAIAEGDLVSQVTQMVLASKLKEIVQEKGIAQALEYCNVNAYPIVDSLEEVYHIKVKRASLKTRNPGDTPNKMERSVINDFSQQIEKGLTPEVKAILDDENVHYFKPIIISAELCLKCHGQIGSDILEKDYEIIKGLYPNDNATGHKLGDLRGIWSITFKKDSLSQD
jgi:hypothetical protein